MRRPAAASTDSLSGADSRGVDRPDESQGGDHPGQHVVATGSQARPPAQPVGDGLIGPAGGQRLGGAGERDVSRERRPVAPEPGSGPCTCQVREKLCRRPLEVVAGRGREGGLEDQRLRRRRDHHRARAAREDAAVRAPLQDLSRCREPQALKPGQVRACHLEAVGNRDGTRRAGDQSASCTQVHRRVEDRVDAQPTRLVEDPPDLRAHARDRHRGPPGRAGVNLRPPPCRLAPRRAPRGRR